MRYFPQLFWESSHTLLFGRRWPVSRSSFHVSKTPDSAAVFGAKRSLPFWRTRTWSCYVMLLGDFVKITLKIWGLRRAARFTALSALTYTWAMRNTWKQVKQIEKERTDVNFGAKNWRQGCGRLSRRFTWPCSWDHPSLSCESRVTLMKLRLDPGRSGDCSDWVVPSGWFLWLADSEARNWHHHELWPWRRCHRDLFWSSQYML